MAKHRRRTFLIKTGLQLRYMGIIVSTMLLVAFGVGWIIYFTSWSRISDTKDLTIDRLAEIFDSVNRVLVQWVGVFIILIAILSIFVSHKIAGPVYRFERSAKVIASGDLTQRVKLRYGDELRELQDAFNTMTDSLCDMVKKDREVIQKLIGVCNRLNESLRKPKQDPQALEGAAKDLYSVIEELRQVTKVFKIDQSGAPVGGTKEGESPAA